MQMTRLQTQFFMGKLSLFYTTTEIMEVLSVTRPTVERWLSGETTPSISHLPIFVSALEGLLLYLDKYAKHHGTWAREIADVIEAQTMPSNNVTISPKNEADAVTRFLKGLLGNKPMKSQEVFKRAQELDFTRPQVIYSAKKLGVIKRQMGQGRNSYSVWRLP